jgi:diguanylate cyclase (GGDEF)-like protein
MHFGTSQGRLSSWRSRHAIGLLILSVVAFGLFIAAAGAILVRNSYDRAFAIAARELDSLSLVTVDQADRALQTVDLLLDSVGRLLDDYQIGAAADVPARLSGRVLHDALARLVDSLPQVTSVSLIDARGNVVNISSAWPAPAVNILDRDYFRELMRRDDEQRVVSAPLVSRVNGAWSIHVARRISDRQGGFAGAVLVSVKLSYFEDLYRAIAPAPDYAFTLLRTDNILVLRHPPRPDLIGHRSALATGRRVARAQGGPDVVRSIGVIDGEDRLEIERPIPHFPLKLHVSRTVAATLASWWRWTRLCIVVIAGMELGLAGLVLLGARQIRVHAQLARARAERGAAEARARTRAALLQHYVRFATVLNTLSQGLCMFDHRARLLVANRRLAELFGLAELPANGATLTECVARLAGDSALSERDVRRSAAAIRRWVASGLSRRTVWPLEDGRAFAVGFQPMTGAGWLLTFEDVTAQRSTAARLAYMAHHDPLTGLANRALCRERLEQALQEAQRGGTCAVLCLDLDRFKEVNDTLGHAAGDCLLQDVGRRLVRCVRESDTVCRLGGDEFAVIQRAVRQGEDITALAHRIVEELSLPYEMAGKQVTAGVSLGIAVASPDVADAETLLRHADFALYCAKQEEGGCFRLFDPEMQARLETRRALQADMARALARGQLDLAYQPLVSLATRRIVGFEALLRWHHPERGLIAPAEFIPAAEEVGLIVPIGEWALHRACATAASWPDHLRLAVNLSPAQFRGGAVLGAVTSALLRSRLPPHRLELEITESALLGETAETFAAMAELRRLGVALVMDDFGTGYSSLGYLHRFPFDRVKIDRSFVQDLGRRREALAIVRAILGMCRSLGIATLAEGVETEEQLLLLRDEDCLEGQGFLFGHPVEARAVTLLLEVAERAVATPVG